MVTPRSRWALFLQDPGIPEGALSHLSSLLLKFFDSTCVNPTTFVDQMTSSGRLARTYVSNDDDVDFGSGSVLVFTTRVFWRQTHGEKANLFLLPSYAKHAFLYK